MNAVSTVEPDRERNGPTRREKIRVAWLCGFLFLAVYGLSAFPMSWLSKRIDFPQFDQGLQIFYAPLIFAARIYFAIFRGG